MLQKRNNNVLLSFVVAMIIGAASLSLPGSPISSADAFSLADYYDLNSVELAIDSYRPDRNKHWQSIETVKVFPDSAGRITGCHFLIGNGVIGPSGQVLATSLWKDKSCCNSDATTRGSIRIGLILDHNQIRPNQIQLKRAELLADTLAQKYAISSDSITVPIF